MSPPLDTPPNLRYSYGQMEALRKELKTELQEYVRHLVRAETAKFEANSARLDAVKDDADEAKRISISARDKAMKPHDCAQSTVLEELKRVVGGWSAWWKGIVVTVIIAVASLGAVTAKWWSSLERTQVEVKNLQTDVSEVSQAVQSTRNDVQTLKNTLENQNAEQLESVTEAVKNTIQREMSRSRRR